MDAIDRASTDDRVKGMVAKIGAVPMGMAQTQELREAVQRFRAHKKLAVAYAETFGEFGPGNNSYYLATPSIRFISSLPETLASLESSCKRLL